jgi:AraC-like DNA-binding protein
MFEPDSLQICLNFLGHGAVQHPGAERAAILPQTLSRHVVSRQVPDGHRERHDAHRFLVVNYGRRWLADVFRGAEAGLCEDGGRFLGGSGGHSTVGLPLPAAVRHCAEELAAPPVAGPCEVVWLHAKLVELATLTLTDDPEELFCGRQKRISRDRVERVKRALARDLEHPPTLADLGKEVACSPAYLSRTFAEATGVTISRYVRDLRLDRAAELLRGGEHNVTEAAMCVGYSSLSHFSKAFAARFGSCPCAFGLPDRSGKR